MPKRIENLRESILSSAKTELLCRGYAALGIRSVARACGVAVGTIYNYFPSKDMLVASVMLADWNRELGCMQSACEETKNVLDALSALYGGVSRFYGEYRAVWSGYTFSPGAKTEYGSRHNLLVRQLSACIRPVLLRFHPHETEPLDVFFAENVLTCAGDSDLKFDAFLRICARVLNEKRS